MVGHKHGRNGEDKALYAIVRHVKYFSFVLVKPHAIAVKTWQTTQCTKAVLYTLPIWCTTYSLEKYENIYKFEWAL